MNLLTQKDKKTKKNKDTYMKSFLHKGVYGSQENNVTGKYVNTSLAEALTNL